MTIRWTFNWKITSFIHHLLPLSSKLNVLSCDPDPGLDFTWCYTFVNICVCVCVRVCVLNEMSLYLEKKLEEKKVDPSSSSFFPWSSFSLGNPSQMVKRKWTFSPLFASAYFTCLPKQVKAKHSPAGWILPIVKVKVCPDPLSLSLSIFFSAAFSPIFPAITPFIAPLDWEAFLSPSK